VISKYAEFPVGHLVGSLNASEASILAPWNSHCAQPLAADTTPAFNDVISEDLFPNNPAKNNIQS